MKHVFIIIALSGVLFLCGLPVWSQTAAGSENNTSVQSAAEDQGATQSTDGEAAGQESTDTARPSAVNEEELAILDTQSPQVELEEGLNTFTVWDFLRMVLVLGGVIAAIYGIFFLLKRVGNPRTQPDSLINVLSTQNLQGNRSLHLVEVGNEVFLVGSAEGGVQLVSRIEESETLDAIHMYRSQLSAGTQTFQNTLKGIFSKTSASTSASNGQGSAVNPATATAGSAGSQSTQSKGMHGSALFLQQQRERLKNL
ncbi:MAG: flagellar biosynthetic protein FliO [Spirochaetaceae bacterium]|nr:flagellar biosynthetic protein FliO [Spirochaetaceae bacterium]MCF7947122.1 flagellar biosynthetic protein FliO [Spirochaetia bacterium]MCF7950123.1 flagellar biosynthetic protein FliO [Spirochaetaceae bacterium]